MRMPALLALTLLAGCAPQPDATSALAPPVPAAQASKPARSTEKIVLRILPLRGMTGKVNRDVRSELERALRARGVATTRRATGWTHELRGRFTSLNEASATSVTYVYDIAPAGRSDSIRITGFERAAGSSSDPWRTVDATLARRLAQRSTERILQKLR